MVSERKTLQLRSEVEDESDPDRSVQDFLVINGEATQKNCIARRSGVSTAVLCGRSIARRTRRSLDCSARNAS